MKNFTVPVDGRSPHRIHDDKCLRQMLLAGYVIPVPENQHNIIEDAIASGDFKRVSDHAELQLGALHGPCFFRWWQGPGQ